jgi:outer membrane protein
MKKVMLFAATASLMFAACGGDKAKSEQQEGADVAANGVVELPTDAPVVSGDVVYIDIDYTMMASKLYQKEGKVFEQKMADYRKKVEAAQIALAKQEQALAEQYNKLQAEAAKLQDDFNRGLITSIEATRKQEDIQKRGAELQGRMADYDKQVQQQAADFQKEEQVLVEEQNVVINRFQKLLRDALDEINADKRYKMIVNAVSVVDADPSLNISSIVLTKVDELYEGGALD